MRLTLYYNFDEELYREGKDTFEVTMFNFPFELEILDKKVLNTMTLNELYNTYRDKAFNKAAKKWMNEYADFAFNVK